MNLFFLKLAFLFFSTMLRASTSLYKSTTRKHHHHPSLLPSPCLILSPFCFMDSQNDLTAIVLKSDIHAGTGVVTGKQENQGSGRIMAHAQHQP